MALRSRTAVMTLCGAVAFAVPIAASPGVALAQGAAAVVISPTGTFDARTGQAVISGTFDCGDFTGPALINVGSLIQQVGRVSTVVGSGFADIAGPCTPGRTGTWSAPVIPTNGEFRGGKAFASAQLVVDGTPVAETGQTVRLTGHR